MVLAEIILRSAWATTAMMPTTISVHLSPAPSQANFKCRSTVGVGIPVPIPLGAIQLVLMKEIRKQVGDL